MGRNSTYEEQLRQSTSWYKAIGTKRPLLLLRLCPSLSFWFYYCMIMATQGVTFHQWGYTRKLILLLKISVNGKHGFVRHSLCPHLTICKCYLSHHPSLPLPHTTAHFKSPSLHNLALWIVFYSKDHLAFVFELT